MNDEQLLIDEMNDFENFMENADVEEIKKEQGLSLVNISSPKFKEGVYSHFNITNISNDNITIYNSHKRTIDLPLYYNDEGYYFFLDSKYISCGIAFDDISNNIYGLLLKDVNSWIISDFPLYSVKGIELYLKLYYKHNPIVEPVQNEPIIEVEVIESPQDIHNRICSNFDIVEKTLYEICVDLKTIRDNKYYKQLGYDTFEDYCLDNFNLNRRTVYRYISVAENLSNDFVTSTLQNKLGVSKLYVLSRLTDDERTELLETTDIEHTPVKQVEQKAKEIKQNREVPKPDKPKNTVLDVYPSLKHFFDSLKYSHDYLGQLFVMAFTMELSKTSVNTPSFKIKQSIECMTNMIKLCKGVLKEIEKENNKNA